jgi:hypothetical protein
VDAEDEHWIAVRRNRIAIDGKWQRVGDAPADQWWARAAWSVGREARG